MFKILKTLSHSSKQQVRTFLSQAYYCNEVWSQRLNSPILQNINLDELYHELDQRFQKTRQMSAVDVDIFTNTVKDNSFVDELLDLVHKLRLSADTRNTLSSTSHAVVRNLLEYERADTLVNVLDDRLNYGLFIDFYTGNLLMDSFWKSKNHAAGARIASQFMLQEETGHSLTRALSLLHCYCYLVKPEGWPEPVPLEEPEEEVKVRVKFLRNEYNDQHFDLRDPNKIVGKTLLAFTKNCDDDVSKSFGLIGAALSEQNELATKLANSTTNFVSEIINLLPEDNEIRKLVTKTQSMNVPQLLEEQVQEAVKVCSEKDIAEQSALFVAWEEERIGALEAQKERLERIRRLAAIDVLQKEIKEKETRLWFFENQEDIELEIEERELLLEEKQNSTTQTKVEEPEADYVPPEVRERVHRK